MADASTAKGPGAPAEASVPWIDRLRVWGAFAVIALHVSGATFRAYAGAPTFRWLDACLWNSATRWAVPVYVLLSGYLLLAPERAEGAIAFWRRRASRIAVPLLFWGVLYALVHGARTPGELVRRVLVRADAAYHLWFLYMLAVLYLLAPALAAALRRLPPAGRVALCAACLAVTLHVPGRAPLLPPHALPRWLDLAAPYVGYFLLGALLRRQTGTPRLALPLLAAVAGLAAAVLGTAAVVVSKGTFAGGRAFQDAASPHVIVLAWSLCLLARGWGERFPGPRLQRLAPAVLGVYLVHPLWIEGLWRVGVRVDRIPAPLSIPLVTAGVAALSFASVAAMRRVPLLRRTV
jgi:surface polysaccharide O-acyltransferase-like enzyme